MPPKRKIPCPSSESTSPLGKLARVATVDILDQDTDSVPGTPEADIQDQPTQDPSDNTQDHSLHDVGQAIVRELQWLNIQFADTIRMLRCDIEEAENAPIPLSSNTRGLISSLSLRKPVDFGEAPTYSPLRMPSHTIGSSMLPTSSPLGIRLIPTVSISSHSNTKTKPPSA